MPRPIADWRAIEGDAGTRTVRLPRGMRLDFGGAAKGWAADQAARRLSAVAPVMKTILSRNEYMLVLPQWLPASTQPHSATNKAEDE